MVTNIWTLLQFLLKIKTKITQIKISIYNREAFRELFKSSG